ETHHGLTTIFEEVGSKKGCEFAGEVPTAPLGAILSPQEMHNARLIKIDVEGAEWLVVTGLAQLLSSGRPDLEGMVELNPARLAHQGKSPEDVLSIFRDAGFHAYHMENDYSTTRYLTPQIEKKPARLRAPIEHEMDVIFSRQDVEQS